MFRAGFVLFVCFFCSLDTVSFQNYSFLSLLVDLVFLPFSTRWVSDRRPGALFHLWLVMPRLYTSLCFITKLNNKSVVFYKLVNYCCVLF